MKKFILSTNFLKKNNFFLLIILSFVFFRASVYQDPDFGWHLQTGRLILSQGIPTKDPFSYSMPDYSYVDHSWLTDALLARIYDYLGTTALSLMFGSLFLIVAWLTTSFYKTRLRFISFTLLILACFPYSGIRTQVVGWVFFAILLLFLLKRRLWQRGKFFIPIIFLLWSNMHGSFVSGLVVLAVSFLADFFEERKIDLEKVYLFFLSVVATIFNPYGISLWREVIDTVFSRELKANINEWQSALLVFDFSVILLFCISVVFLWRYRKKFDLKLITLFIFWFFQGILSKRNIPLWSIIATMIFLQGFIFFEKEISKKRTAKARFTLSLNFLKLLTAIIFVVQIFLGTKESLTLTESVFYPREAVSFLNSYRPSGNVFSEYGWGGYLIWKYPEKKIFIDGRMAIWSSNGYSAFMEYREVISGKKNYKEIFEKFNINVVLWPNKESKSREDGFLPRWFKILLSREREGKFEFVNELRKNGWEEIYSDSVAVILVKT